MLAQSLREPRVRCCRNLASITYRNPLVALEKLSFLYESQSSRLFQADPEQTPAGATGGPLTDERIGYAQDSRGARGVDTEEDWSNPSTPQQIANTDRNYFYSPAGRLDVFEGRIPQSSGSGYQTRDVFYLYDHLGRRIRKDIVVDSAFVESWLYFYDLEGQLISEIRAQSSSTELYDYVYLDGRPVLQRGASSSGIVDKQLVTNHLGQPIVGFDPYPVIPKILYRADPDAFGWTTNYGYDQGAYTVNQYHMLLRFPGHYEDVETAVAIHDPNSSGDTLLLPSALHYNVHRYYDPMIGRYLRPEPIGQLGDAALYRYARYDPVRIRKTIRAFVKGLQ